MFRSGNILKIILNELSPRLNIELPEKETAQIIKVIQILILIDNDKRENPTSSTPAI